MISFIITVAFVYLFYYIFIIRKYDAKGNKIVKESKINGKGKIRKTKAVDQVKYPSEVELFIYKYKIDIKRINFRAMLKLLGLVCSMDIAIIVTILSYIKLDMIWLLLIGAVLVFPIILISFSLLGRYFKKKGLTKHV